jgi:hypothetical protein
MKKQQGPLDTVRQEAELQRHHCFGRADIREMETRPRSTVQEGNVNKGIASADVTEMRTENIPKTGMQQNDNNGTVNQNFVSFYFTNVLDDISYYSLRQGFEVCGIMEDVYLARKRNVNGALFDFVRYAKVKDVEKLLKAVNNVWFGECKVVAKVSSFDRYGNKLGEGGNRSEG